MAKKTSLPVAKLSKQALDREKRWQAEDDLRTLQRADEIKKDTKRMKAAECCAKEQVAALQKVLK